jgi:hypothetical protein
MGPPEIKTDPTIVAQQKAAEQDRIDATRDRLSNDTRDLLLRFGRNKAFSGAGDLGGGLGNLPAMAISGASADNLFSGRGRLRL